MKKIILICFIALLTFDVIAQTDGDYQTRADGNWNSNAVWQVRSGGVWVNCLAGDYPGVGAGAGLVSILNGHVVTLNISPANNLGSLDIMNGNQDSYINFNGTNSLTVTGTTTLRANSNNDQKAIRVDAGTFTTGSFSATGTGNTRDAYIRISTGNVYVLGDLTLNSTGRRTYILFTGAGTLFVGGNMSGGIITSTAGGHLTNPPTSGTVNYNSAGAQQAEAYTYFNLTTSGGGTKSLVGATTVNNNLTLTSGVLQLGNNDLTITNSASTAIQGAAFDATNMIETNGIGYVIRNAVTTLPVLFPVGAGGFYSPASITAVSATTGTVNVRTEQDFTLGSNFLDKFWDVITSITGKTITATFSFDAAEIPGTPTDIYVRPTAGAWQVPVGTQGFTATSFTITGTTDMVNTVSSWTAEASSTTPSDTYFSYQTGNWNVATNWTSDPGGTTQVGTTVPGNGDVVVILSGRTISLSEDCDTANLEININEGGILDMTTFAFTDAGGLDELNGQGKLRLSSTSFPTATTNTFVNTGGGTTEYYNVADFTLPIAQTTYNHLEINAPAVAATQMSNITLNGDLDIKQGTYQINDNTSARRQLTVNGDVTVDAGASITVGTGVTNTTTDPTAVAEGGTAPFINYYDTQSHRVVLNGDFTNNGTVKFTNLTYPIFNLLPPTILGATSGFATVYFQGATNNTLTCNSTTDFYNLVLDKGVDQSFSLTVYSTAYSNFRLFGANTAGGYGGGSDPNLNKALWIRTGTFVLQGLTIIPSLSEGACDSGTGGPNSDFYIPANGAFLLDGTDVVVLSTADDYREVNIAYGVSGGTGLANGVNQGGCSSFSVLGKFQVNNGYFSTRESGGLITWSDASGQFVINGGTVDAKQFRSAGGGGGLASFDQSGGTFILRGLFQRQPTAYTAVSDLKDFSVATLNTTRLNSGLNGALGTFNLNEAENVFTMSGGTIRIYDVCGDGSVAAQQKVFEVLSSTGNINVTGGTLELIPTTGTGGDSPNHIVISNASLNNLTINRASSTSIILLNTYPLNVLNNLTLTSGEFTTNNLDVSVGGDFSIANGTTYTPGTNSTIFNGSGSQSFTVNTAATLALKKFKIDKPAGTTLTLAGSQSTIFVQDSMMIVNGNLADGAKTINFTTSTTTTTSYLYNSGVHSGTGKIVLADDDPQIITGDGTGIFQNLELNNTDALAAPVSLGSNMTVNGILTLSQDKLFDISTYNLQFGSSATIANAGANRYIQSAGNAGDGGVTKTFSATSTSFIFPIGAPSTGHVAAEYTPATLAFGTAPTTYGSINVIPVGYEHPNTTTKGRSLTYFWRVKSSGFTLGAATITHTYTYSQNDVVGPGPGDPYEDEYVAANYDNTTFTWTKGTATDVDEATNIIGGAGTSYQNVGFIEGEFTAGDDNPTDPFGTPVVYYSRINGAAAGNGLWSNVNTWSTDPVLQHTGAAAAAAPGASDIAIVGGLDSVYLVTNLTVANAGIQNSATLLIEVGSTLDIGYNPGCNFGIVRSHPSGNGNFRLTTSSASGSFYVFPSGDFSDYNVNQGTTEFYTTSSVAGRYYILPSNANSYGTVILSAIGGSNVILPNIPYVTIYGDLIGRGETWESWLAMTWNGTYGAIVPKTVDVRGNLDIQGGSLVYIYNVDVAQNLIVNGDVIVHPGAGIDMYPTSRNNKLYIGGSLINNTDNSAPAPYGGYAGSNVRFIRDANSKCDVIFFGSNNASITNQTATQSTIFNNVTVNKGSSQADTLTIDIDGTLTTPTNNWLTLQNGTLKYSRTDPGSDFTISTTNTFTIPSTAGLYIDYPDNATGQNILIANAASSTNDLYLNGKLSVINGDVYIGRTNGTTNNNNDIEYSGGGASAIDIQGGSLIVNGQIRRNPASTNGVLSYTQSNGDLVINGQAAIASNAKLEVCNPGSVFDMSGGTLTIVRGGGTTYGDLYIRAATSTVTGGEIIFTQSPSIGPVVDAVQNYILDANVALNHLTITGKTAATARNATVTLLISPLTLNGDLTISNANSILDANTNFDIDVTIKGGFTNNGLYNHYNNLTTFSGGAQSIQGSTATTFYDLLVNPVTSLTLIRDITVYNDLTLSSGQLLGSTFNINVEGDLINNANYDGDANQGGVILNGTGGLQYISGTGTFGRLELDNSDGARLNNAITLQKNLKLTSGILDINQYLLTLGANSDIEGSSFSSTKMIASDGVFSNVGLRKYFSIYSGVEQIFTYPMGTSGKYTPAKLKYTDNTNVGFVRINNINDHHPGVIDDTNVLKYFWEVESSGIAGFNGSLVLNYEDADVQVTGVNTEADYIAARLIKPGTSWIKSIDNVDEIGDSIIYFYSGTDNLSGEYTAGIDAAIPTDIPEYTSIITGDWSDETNWTNSGGDVYPCPVGGPNGFIVIVDVGDTVTTDANYASAYITTINGMLKIASTTFGHNLGTLDGTGTLFLESATFPAGRYTDFFDCSNTSTLEYGGSTDYNIVADLYSSLPKLHFTGTGTRTLPNKDLTVCTQLLIDGPTLNNSVNNRKLTIQGTMERYNTGAFNSGSGAGAIVSFEGSAAQTIGGALGDFTGTSDFNYFEINNSAGLTINAGGAIEVAGNLLLTSGNIVTAAANTLTITNTVITSVTPLGGSSASYVDGPLIKNINQGDNFVFPIGKGSVLGSKITISSVRVGTISWTAEYFTPNVTYASLTAPLTYVNSQEYWTLSAGSGDEATVGLDWDPLSDLTPLMTQNGLTDMRVANYNTGTTSWEEVTSTAVGDDNNGTVTTSSEITLPAAGTSDYTLACINVTKPRARLNPTGAVCGADGIPVSFTGSALAYDYIITYEKGGVLQAAITITSGDVPYTLPTDAVGTTYQLISFIYNDPASPTTGVVDPATVTTYTVPTASAAGPDQSICGGTSATLAGNDPVPYSGLWTIISGAGGTVVTPTDQGSVFNGTNGTTYEIEWAISNGGCISRDTVIIDFPLLPVQPGAFTASSAIVCQGETGVVYTVPNDPTVTYTWDYSGTGATIVGTGNSVTIDYASNATGGTVGVFATNGCGDSAPREIVITINPLPTATITIAAALDTICNGANTRIDIDFTTAALSWDLVIDDGTNPTETINGVGDPYAYIPAVAPIWVDDGTPDTDYVYTIQITDSNTCVNTLSSPTVTVFKIPETGPQYHISNDNGY